MLRNLSFVLVLLFGAFAVAEEVPYAPVESPATVAVGAALAPETPSVKAPQSAILETFQPEAADQWNIHPKPAVKSAEPDGLSAEADFSVQPMPERISFERNVTLDLSGWSCFELEAELENVGVFRCSTLYFHSGNGWYSCTGPIYARRGVYGFEKGDFAKEGNPTDWDKIDAIRISFWGLKPQKSMVKICELRGIRNPLLFVTFQTPKGIEFYNGAKNTRLMLNMLHPLQIPSDRVSVPLDIQPEAWEPLLKDRLLVILSYTGYMKPEVGEYLKQWSAEHGVPVFFVKPPLEKQPMELAQLVEMLTATPETTELLQKTALETTTRLWGQKIPNADEVETHLRTLFTQGKTLEGLQYGQRVWNENLHRAALETSASPQLKFRGWWNHSGLGAYPGDWARTARELKAAGFTDVFPNMLWADWALYPSDFLPPGDGYLKYGDQVQACVDACHKEGLKVHIWNVCWNMNTHSRPEHVAKMREAGRLQVDAWGRSVPWYCPSHPENLQLECDTMVELARKYDIDGLHFDYIRYPDGGCCYCEGCRQRFEAATGCKVENWPADVRRNGPLYTQYQQWRASCITELVQRVHDQVKQIKPNVQISAAVFNTYPGSRENEGQDWVLWAQKGCVDFLCPMDYTRSLQSYESLVQNQKEILPKDFPFYPGIGQFRLTPDEVIEQIRLTEKQGARGFLLFDLTPESAKTVLPLMTKPTTD